MDALIIKSQFNNRASIWLLAKLQESSYIIVVSYLSIKTFLLLILLMPHLIFPNPPHIHLVHGPTIAYAFVSNLLLAREPSSPLYSAFSLLHYYLLGYKPIIIPALIQILIDYCEI
jgi:hypothetical protein